MKDLVKRFLIGFMLFFLVMIVLQLTINFFKKREIKYTHLNSELVMVRLFYEL